MTSVPVVLEEAMARDRVCTAVQPPFSCAGLSYHSSCSEISRTDSWLGQTPCRRDGSIPRSHVAEVKVCHNTNPAQNASLAAAYPSHPTFSTPPRSPSPSLHPIHNFCRPPRPASHGPEASLAAWTWLGWGSVPPPEDPSRSAGRTESAALDSSSPSDTPKSPK